MIAPGSGSIFQSRNGHLRTVAWVKSRSIGALARPGRKPCLSAHAARRCPCALRGPGSCVTPKVRKPGWARCKAREPKPGREPPPAARRRPGVPRQRQAVQHRSRRLAPNSSRASHNAIRDANRHAIPIRHDTTAPTPALAATRSLRTRRLRSHKPRSEHGKTFSAWSLLLPDPTTRRTHAAIRPDIAGTTRAPRQRGKQTDTDKHPRPSVIRKSHRYFLHGCSAIQPQRRNA